MTTTLQQIQDRAVAFSSANGLSSLISDTSEIISRIQADQEALYAGLADQWGALTQVSASVASTSGSSGRTISLVITPPIRRVISLILANGQRVREVAVDDQDARHSPRYYILGSSLVEVGSDWGATGVANATLVYAGGPVVLAPSGALTQLVTIADEWTDLLVLPLAMYLVQKDVGRESAEYERLERVLASRRDAYTTYLANYSGEIVREAGE